MKKILLFNPALSTINKGDEIIYTSALPYIKKMYPDAFYTEISTHLPVSFRYMYYLRDMDLRFVCGTNLLKGNMLFGFRQWDISLLKAPFIGKCVLIGCGWWQYGSIADPYSILLYKSVLSKDYMHSVRDEYTLNKLNSMGIKNVLNTGCPTMWGFTPDFCDQIPSGKSDGVVTTITDYRKDPEKDSQMLNLLCENYANVHLWLQGIEDEMYFSSLDIADKAKIKIIPPDLKSYDELLDSHDVDYVGTRLHAGIRALQHKRRSLIIAVDNRAKEINKNTDLPILDRHSVSSLTDWINREQKTQIKINQKEISEFLSQFKVDK